ncbi:MAG: putative DNA-binding domain-containing protein, partial [Methylocystis sp.]|nr:putative DNA-binding domain-containing protein [Methylocystis sp.]
MKLAELQSTFQAGVLAGGEPDNAAILGSIRNSKRADRTTLFGVYVNAYRLRLAEFLTTDFPALRALIGEAAFDALAEDFIAAEPSRRRKARWCATRLPDFMRDSETWRNETRAIDLARFECALADAFDAPEAPALAAD